MPVEKVSLLKDPSSCVCKGKRTIPDPSDDTEKWQQVKSNAEANLARLTKLENLCSPACGNMHTLIQGHALWEIGIGMNDAPSYRVDQGKSVRNYGHQDVSKINVKQGGPILAGASANHVQGINSLASPGGHGMIKCANKFSVVAGAQGIDLTTGGPLNITAGIIKITGPELTIGTQTGRLVLEGETVNLNGKSIECAPSDGHFVNRGTFSNTGNIINSGHMHSESASVVNLAVPGTNYSTKPSAPSDKQTMQAFWGGANAESVSPLLKDLTVHASTNKSHPTLASAVAMPRFLKSLGDKVTNLTYALQPYEKRPTGYILPGTQVQLVLTSGVLNAVTGLTSPEGPVTGNASYIGGTLLATVGPAPVLLNNFPHSHQLPDGNHPHDFRGPLVDFSSDDAGAVRGLAAGAASAAPVNKSVSLQEGLNIDISAAIGTAAALAWGKLGESDPKGVV
tara:strand:- start:404 stop:1762 length:1359 start_codon:yes stop_codon:yes gene_type:complete